MTLKGSLEGKIKNTVARMEVGDEDYTYPAALTISQNEDKYNVFLDTSFPVFPTSSNFNRLYIKRISPEENGFEVDLDSVDSPTWNIKNPPTSKDIVKIGETDMF